MFSLGEIWSKGRALHGFATLTKLSENNQKNILNPDYMGPVEQNI